MRAPVARDVDGLPVVRRRSRGRRRRGAGPRRRSRRATSRQLHAAGWYHARQRVTGRRARAASRQAGSGGRLRSHVVTPATLGQLRESGLGISPGQGRGPAQRHRADLRRRAPLRAASSATRTPCCRSSRTRCSPVTTSSSWASGVRPRRG